MRNGRMRVRLKFSQGRKELKFGVQVGHTEPTFQIANGIRCPFPWIAHSLATCTLP